MRELKIEKIKKKFNTHFDEVDGYGKRDIEKRRNTIKWYRTNRNALSW
jgi:hypothetical protein